MPTDVLAPSVGTVMTKFWSHIMVRHSTIINLMQTALVNMETVCWCADTK